MKRWSLLLLSVAAAMAVHAQKIETQKPDRTRIIRVETALNHLTVIEVGDPVEQVAAGSTSFKVEWRGNKVFVQPLEPDAETNLFIWTRSGTRLSYELVPAGAVERMHFAIDQEPLVTAAAAAPQPAAAVAEKKPPIPEEMLFKSSPVKFAGAPGQKSKVAVLLRDVYERDGKMYVRYSIRNEGTAPYRPGEPVVTSLNSPRGTTSLYGMRRTQLGDKLANRITAKSVGPVRVVHSEVETAVVSPGQETVGFVAMEVSDTGGPHVLRMKFAAVGTQDVIATLVL